MAEWRMKMATARISREAAEFSIRQVLYPKLWYPLIATMFLEVQCKQIVKLVLNQGLLALGINRHLPQAVAHGPWKFQGLNLPNLYMEQVVTHSIHTLLQFGAQPNNPTSQLLRANGEALWMEAGLNGQLFQILLAVLPCLTDTWLSWCWHQCHLLKIPVMADIKEFKQPRHGDKEIMQIFLRDGARGVELAALNQCRMYLQVIFVSEICNGEGTKVKPHYWEGKRQQTHHPTNGHKCTHQPRQTGMDGDNA